MHFSSPYSELTRAEQEVWHDAALLRARERGFHVVTNAARRQGGEILTPEHEATLREFRQLAATPQRTRPPAGTAADGNHGWDAIMQRNSAQTEADLYRTQAATDDRHGRAFGQAPAEQGRRQPRTNNHGWDEVIEQTTAPTGFVVGEAR